MIGQAVNAVSVAIVRDGTVLLVRRANPPYAGFWTLPGGRLDTGESSEAAARREIAEELGLVLSELTPLTRLAATTGWRLQVFAANWPGGDVRPSREVADWRWAAAGSLAGLETTPGLTGVIELALRELPSVT